MLMADYFKDYSQTCFVTGGVSGAMEKLVAVFTRLEEEAAREFPSQRIRFERFLDARYKRQSHEISIPFSRSYVSDFHKAHERHYGYSKPESEVEVVTVRIRAVIEKEKVSLPRLKNSVRQVSRMPIGLSYNGTEISASCYRREEFYEGYRFSGPALVLEKTSTLFIPPGFNCLVDEFGNIFAHH
jgi:N-methylhydantoinase A